MLLPCSSQIPLPSRPHWYLLFGASEEEIKEICITTLRLYTRKKVVVVFFRIQASKRAELYCHEISLNYVQMLPKRHEPNQPDPKNSILERPHPFKFDTQVQLSVLYRNPFGP